MMFLLQLNVDSFYRDTAILGCTMQPKGNKNKHTSSFPKGFVGARSETVRAHEAF